MAGSGPTGDLLPGWTLSLSGFQLTSLGYNSAGSEAGGHAGIFERPVLEAQYYSISQIPPADKGKYALVFDHGDGFPSYEIVQRGDVPADARLIQINGYHLSGSGFFTANMDGVPIVGRDITAFAGKNVELKITSEWVLPPFPQVPAGTPVAFIDRVSFSVLWTLA